jgi:hypothetical protein
MGSYVVLLYQDEAALDRLTDAQRTNLLEQHGAFQSRHRTAIKLSDALQRTAAARAVHVGDGSVSVTDGPFVETKEALGGFYVIEAADLDEAIAIAAEVPAPHGGVEVRPVMVFDQ